MSSTPVALLPRSSVHPDLWPLHRRPPPHVEDPGPRTLLRDGGDTGALVAATRAAVTDAPQRWTGAVPDLPAPRWRAAGVEVARLAADAVPQRLVRDEHGVLHLPDVQVTVDPDGGLGTGADATTEAAAVVACLAEVPPEQRALHAVALAVAEDLVVIDSSGRVVWLHVTAPSGWDPGAAVGAPLATLHGPVPDAERLRAATRALARAVTTGGPFVRWTWGVSATPTLPVLPAQEQPPLPGEVGAWTFRAERQTTAPLTEAELGLFTIRVHRAPLSDVITTPARAQRLAGTVGAMSPRMAAYKGLGEDRDRLEGWLAARG